MLNDHIEFDKDLSEINQYKVSKKGGNLNE